MQPISAAPCARHYVPFADEALVSDMAATLRPLQSFDIKGVAQFALVKAGFAKTDIRRYRDAAIDREKLRRLAFGAHPARRRLGARIAADVSSGDKNG